MQTMVLQGYTGLFFRDIFQRYKSYRRTEGQKKHKFSEIQKLHKDRRSKSFSEGNEKTGAGSKV